MQMPKLVAHLFASLWHDRQQRTLCAALVLRVGPHLVNSGEQTSSSRAISTRHLHTKVRPVTRFEILELTRDRFCNRRDRADREPLQIGVMVGLDHYVG